jgi:hypothetical protein
MLRNRLFDQSHGCERSSTALQTIPAGGFMMCPLALCAAAIGQQTAWQQTLYQAAFERAQEATQRPSLYERDWLGVWN